MSGKQVGDSLLTMNATDLKTMKACISAVCVMKIAIGSPMNKTDRMAAYVVLLLCGSIVVIAGLISNGVL
jgi:hypothetical protein